MARFTSAHAAIALTAFGAAIITIPTASTQAQGAGKAFTVTETGRSYGSLQSALNAIGNKRATITIAHWR